MTRKLGLLDGLLGRMPRSLAAMKLVGHASGGFSGLGTGAVVALAAASSALWAALPQPLADDVGVQAAPTNCTKPSTTQLDTHSLLSCQSQARQLASSSWKATLAVPQAISAWLLPSALAEAKASIWARSTNPGSAAVSAVHSIPADLPPFSAAATCLALTGPLAAIVLRDVASPQPHLLRAACDRAQQAGLANMPSWEVATLAWGLAYLSSDPARDLEPSFLRSLQAYLSSQAKSMPLKDIVVLSWALSNLGAMSPDTWSSVMTALSKFRAKDFDEHAVLYLLHASLAASVGADQRLQLTGATAAAPVHSSTAEPRPGREAVEAFLQSLNKEVRAKVLQAYREYMPMDPSTLGPYMLLLHVIKTLPEVAQAVSKNTASGYSQLLPAATSSETASQASLLSGSSRDLARLRRDVAYHWRQDTLLDDRQRVVNEVVHLLNHKLSERLAQPPDVDLAVPNKRLVIFIDDDTPSPNTPQAFHMDDGSEALDTLVQHRFSPPTSFKRQALPGVERARRQLVEACGWRVAHIEVSRWKSLKEEKEKLDLLRAVLRNHNHHHHN